MSGELVMKWTCTCPRRLDDAPSFVIVISMAILEFRCLEWVVVDLRLKIEFRRQKIILRSPFSPLAAILPALA